MLLPAYINFALDFLANFNTFNVGEILFFKTKSIFVRDCSTLEYSPRWNIDEFGKETTSKLNIEPGLNEKIKNELISKGHKVNQLEELQNSYGPISAIIKSEDNWIASHDPRVDTASSKIEKIS